MKFVAIIPAYNEELTIATVVLLTKEHVDEVVVVDDGSKDRTAIVAEMAGAKVISLTANQGKAGALLAGFSYVKEKDYDFIVLLDADGQNNPSQIPSILEPVIKDQFDLVIGSRFKGEKQDIPRYRRVGQKILNVVTHASSGTNVGDSQSGFRAFNKHFLEIMDMDSKGFSIETDMINRAVDEKMRITEVPISVRYDVPNPHKKNPLTHGFGVLGNIVNALGYRRPLLLFGTIGTTIMAIGTLLFLAYAFDIDFLKIYLISSSWTFWVTALLFSGLIIFIFGLMLNSQLMIKNELMGLQRKTNNK